MIYTVFNSSKPIQARQIVDGVSGITPREQKNIKKLVNATDKALGDFLLNKAKQKVERDIGNKLLKLLYSEKKNLETYNGSDALIRDIEGALHKLERVVGVQDMEIRYPSMQRDDGAKSTTTTGPDIETTNGPDNIMGTSDRVSEFGAGGISSEVGNSTEYDIFDPSQENVNNIWYTAENRARKYAQSKGFSLSVTVSGIKSRGFGEKPDINRIDHQQLTLTDEHGTEHIIGSIDIQKVHLTSLKTPGELFNEIKILIDNRE